MNKKISTSNNARVRLLQGVNKVANIVKATLGPYGKNVIYTDPNGLLPTVTNDGVSIAKQIQLTDPVEQAGVDIIKQSCLMTNAKAGDGTTTSITLAQAIAQIGFNDGRPVMEIKNQIANECDIVVSALKEMAAPVGDNIRNIARVSAESVHNGDIVAELIEKIGKNGSVTVTAGSEIGVVSEVVSGAEFPQGWISPYMVNNERDEAVLEECPVLICDVKIGNFRDIAPIMEKVVESGYRKLFVVSEGLDASVIATTTLNKMKGIFEVVAVKLPYVDKEVFMQDISFITGAKITGTSGLMIDKMSVEDLGFCDKIIVKQESTTFLGGKGDLDKNIEALKKSVETSKDDYFKNKIIERIARLTGGVGIIRVGAQSEAEMKYLRDKLEDTVNATKCAIDEGIVRGGGLALKEIAERYPNMLIADALRAPYEQIQTNAGKHVDIPDHVFDPVKVTRLAVESACSAAGILITTEAVIAYDNTTKK